MITFPLKTDRENAAVSPLFGKAKYFAFYDGNELKVEKNPYEKGSQLVSWFLEKGVDKIVIKEIGSQPFNKIHNTNIKVYYAGDGRVTSDDVIQKFNKDELKELSDDELQAIIKYHKGEKSSSCKNTDHKHNHEGGKCCDNDHDHNHEGGKCCDNDHEGGHGKNCQKKQKAKHPYVFK